MAVTPEARRQIRSAKAWAGGLAEEDVPMSTALIAIIRAARLHPEAVTTELARLKAEPQQ